ncbi:hypothetical protein WICMUC_003164 [Wickerhamomyces mucosus]|uniref:Phosphotransferase n=1 Tax=Wickerhamomyces mucosus TaxID=1378264 RepID=A0A9P8PM13_9ASCO|nr:hypothetical protein WICMUC_003164 [Wickerhamomyces mucosus]
MSTFELVQEALIPSQKFELLNLSNGKTTETVTVQEEEEEENLEYPSFINDLSKQFQINEIDSNKIYQNFLSNFTKSLMNKDHNHDNNKISMIPIFKFPQNFQIFDNNLKDTKYLSIDIGGSTIRICLIKFLSPTNSNNHDNNNYEIIRYKQWILNESDKLIDLKFFEKLSERAIEVLQNYNDVSCGLVWSFPLDNCNRIKTMGKGFKIDSEVSSIPITELLQISFQNQGKVINVNSVINDSIAVNLTTFLTDNGNQDSTISLILGTGLNSCIQYHDQLYNVELGFFGELLNPSNYDIKLDSRFSLQGYSSFNWKFQKNRSVDGGNSLFMPLEFLCGSRYITELIRIILNEEMGLNLGKEYELHGEFITLFHNHKDELTIRQELIKKFNQLSTLSSLQIQTIKKVIEIVLVRSSIYLQNSLLALDSLLNQDKKFKPIKINYIGSFLQNCQYLQKLMENYGFELKFIENSNLVGGVIASLIEEKR